MNNQDDLPASDEAYQSAVIDSPTDISDLLLSQLSDFVANNIGLYFPKQQWNELKKKFILAASNFGFKDINSCMQWLLSSPLTKSQIEILASYLTVGETYFFREKKTFAVLETEILPQLIDSRQIKEKYLRIWSAGCCTGEEAYTIAILLNKIIADLTDWNITILATDINPLFLQKAEEGIYNNWSFRDGAENIKEKYFKKINNNSFAILSSIKKMVNFFYLNLAEDSFPSLINNTNALDIILCRNVLMYFNRELQDKIIKNFYRCLIEGGLLVVSSSELSSFLFPQFKAVNIDGAVYYKKDSKKSPPLKEEIIFTKTPDTKINFIKEEIKLPIKIYKELPCEPKEEKLPQPKINSYQQALAEYENGHYEKAKEKTLKLLKENQSDTNAIILLAKTLANQGQLTSALQWCEKAIAIDKLNPCFYFLAATILQEQNLVEEAVKYLKRAIYLEQDFILAHFTLANLTKSQQKSKEAKKHFTNTLLLLNNFKDEEILPYSEGITVGRIKEIIKANNWQGNVNG